MNGDGGDTSARLVITSSIPKRKSLTTNLELKKLHQNHIPISVTNFKSLIKHAAALRAVYAFNRK
jgi:hypothetical protein